MAFEDGLGEDTWRHAMMRHELYNYMCICVCVSVCHLFHASSASHTLKSTTLGIARCVSRQPMLASRRNKRPASEIA